MNHQRKEKGIIKFGLSKTTIKKGEVPLIENQMMITDFNKLSKESHSQKKEKKKVKVIKRNNEIILREALETRAESDEESEEYDSDSTPGPGYYSYVNQEKKNFRSKNEKFKKIFINQSKRFLEKNSN